MVAYLGSVSWLGWPVTVHDTHTRRRRMSKSNAQIKVISLWCKQNVSIMYTVIAASHLLQYYTVSVIVTSMSHTTNTFAFKKMSTETWACDVFDLSGFIESPHMLKTRSIIGELDAGTLRARSAGWYNLIVQLLPVLSPKWQEVEWWIVFTVYWRVCSHLQWDTALCCIVGLGRCCGVGAKQVLTYWQELALSLLSMLM